MLATVGQRLNSDSTQTIPSETAAVKDAYGQNGLSQEPVSQDQSQKPGDESNSIASLLNNIFEQSSGKTGFSDAAAEDDPPPVYTPFPTHDDPPSYSPKPAAPSKPPAATTPPTPPTPPSTPPATATPPPAPPAAPPAGPTASDGTHIPQPNDTRPAGDTRSAEQIVDGDATLKNLQKKDQDVLKKQCGDWTDPKLSQGQRDDAAYRASQVLDFIKTSKNPDGSTRSDKVTNDGKIDGDTSKNEARDGTDAAMLKRFKEQGYSYLAASDHKRPKTNDKYVNKDGTTQSDLQRSDQRAKNGLKKVAEGFLKVGKVFEDVASKIAGFVADLKIPIISQVAGVASLATENMSGLMNIGDTALKGGNVKEAAKQLGINDAETAVSAFTAPGVGKALGEGAKAAAEAAKRGAKEGAKEGANQAASQEAQS